MLVIALHRCNKPTNHFRCRRRQRRKGKGKRRTTEDTAATLPFSTTSPCEPSLYLLLPLAISAVPPNHLPPAQDKGKDSHPFKASHPRIMGTVEVAKEEGRRRSLHQSRSRSRGRLRSKGKVVQLVNEEGRRFLTLQICLDRRSVALLLRKRGLEVSCNK